jgi:hypothetical protein
MLLPINQQASRILANYAASGVPVSEVRPLDFGSRTQKEFLSMEMYDQVLSSIIRMGTIFNSATSNFTCMINFALTSLPLGASSAVMPRAGSAIDTSSGDIGMIQ